MFKYVFYIQFNCQFLFEESDIKLFKSFMSWSRYEKVFHFVCLDDNLAGRRLLNTIHLEAALFSSFFLSVGEDNLMTRQLHPAASAATLSHNGGQMSHSCHLHTAINYPTTTCAFHIHPLSNKRASANVHFIAASEL